MAAPEAHPRSPHPASVGGGGASGEPPDLSRSRARSGALLERDEELATLRDALCDAHAGHGRLVVVEARAGCGKSTLLAALADRAAESGMRVLDARGGELERGFAFGTIRQIFERAVADASSEERDGLLAGAAAPAAAVLIPDAAVRGEPGLGTLHAIYWLATNLSLDQPLVIAVDDLHWVDDSSLQVLDYLARRIGDLAVALVVTLRPAEPGASHELLDPLRSQPDALTLRLMPLSAGAVAALVAEAVPGADDALCAACFEATAGNPFYLRELLASLDGTPDAVQVRNAAVPELGDRIVRRIERIGPEAAALARAMAVVGDGGALDAAAAVAGVDPDHAAAAAGQMRRVEILAREDPFAFAHPLVRRSVYDTLTVAERDSAHVAAARVLREAGAAPDAIAAHLRLLRPAGSSEVVAGLRAAAQDALRRGAPAVAASALQRCLDEDAPEPPRCVLLHELGEIEVAVRDLTALGHLDEAMKLADDPVHRARIALTLVAIYAAMGRWDDLLSLIARAIDDLGDRDPDLSLELQTNRAAALAHDGVLIAEYDRDEERLLDLAKGEAWPARALCALMTARWAARGERIDEIGPLAEFALRDGRLLRERGPGAWPIPQVLMALVMIGDLERAVEIGREAADIARHDGSTSGIVMSTAFRCWINVRRGDLAAAEGEAQTMLDIALPNDLQMELGSAYWMLSDAIGEREGIDAIIADAVAVLQPGAEFDRTTAGAMMRELRGRYLYSQGRREESVAELRAAAQVWRAMRTGPLLSTWRSALALALPPQARDEAQALLGEEVRLAERSGLPRPIGIALRAAASVNGHDDEVERLRRSVELLESTDARLEHARSLVALGSALRRSRFRHDAREPLAAALEMAHRCGAERTQALATEELLAAGARPRRPARSGSDALTASEARVARLVAQGRSNAEVAQELFVSLKTVETHMTRIYRKLGLSGPGARRRLAESLPDARSG